MCAGCARPKLMQGKVTVEGGPRQSVYGGWSLWMSSEPIPRSYGVRGEAEMVSWDYNDNWGERPETRGTVETLAGCWDNPNSS